MRHEEQRLRERTSFKPSYLIGIKRALRKVQHKLTPGLYYYANLRDGSKVAIKPTRDNKRHVVATFLSRSMRPKGEEIMLSNSRKKAVLEKVAVKLTANARNHIAESNFALPGRRYPIHDQSHARSALSMVAKHGNPEEQARVRAAVHRRYPSIGSK